MENRDKAATDLVRAKAEYLKALGTGLAALAGSTARSVSVRSDDGYTVDT